ncbi:ester cyclase [Actinomycetospora rhizophila]|uniref:Ester cyclase n=1 Tax=Actinomycetospora rhizophila TaxID=1416876 RepID=A0ABV9ZKX5_9PSEU
MGIEQQARQGIEDFNRGDWDALRAITGADSVYEEPATGRVLTGVDDIMTALQDWRTGVPDVTGEIQRIVTDGDTAVLEIVWRGTQSGPLAAGATTIPPTGRSFVMWSTMWQTWRDGMLIANRHHQDILGMLVQLGVVPAPA